MSAMFSLLLRVNPIVETCSLCSLGRLRPPGSGPPHSWPSAGAEPTVVGATRPAYCFAKLEILAHFQLFKAGDEQVSRLRQIFSQRFQIFLLVVSIFHDALPRMQP